VLVAPALKEQATRGHAARSEKDGVHFLSASLHGCAFFIGDDFTGTVRVGKTATARLTGGAAMNGIRPIVAPA